MTIKEFMKNGHRLCDKLLADTENAVENGDFELAVKINDDFEKETLKHFDMEEKYLFEMFDKQNANSGHGPTAVMKMEHNHVRDLFLKIKEALAQKDTDRYFGLSESLMLLLQQHNMKEEQMLYSMIQNIFNRQNDEIVKKLQNYEY